MVWLMRKPWQKTAALGVVLAIVITLTAAAFGHRPIVSQVDPALQTFLDAGGSLHDLCGDVQNSPEHARSGCDACRIFAAAELPPVTCTRAARLGTHPVDWPTNRDTLLAQSHRARANTARAPPLT